jgi:mannobiose 2-epimerase
VDTQLEESLFEYILNPLYPLVIDDLKGGWYNNATDTYPETIDQGKSHIWKTSYHNARGMLNCIKMLRMK